MATVSAAADSLCKATMHDRAVGTIMGSAIGDAVGLFTEFLSAEDALKEYPEQRIRLGPGGGTQFARDWHRQKHKEGDWTDDTDHAILVLLSFLHSAELSPEDLALRLRTWVLMGLRALDTLPLGLGATVGSIVRNAKYLEDPVGCAHAHWVKSGHCAAPNGSLMRTHPLGVICIRFSWEETFETAARFSAITHVDPRAVASCMLGTALIRGLITGEIRTEQHIDELISAVIADLNDRITPMFKREGPFTEDDPGLDAEEFKKHVTVTSLDELELDKGGIGYVLKCLGSGILLLRLAMRRVLSAKAEISAPRPPTRPGEPILATLGPSRSPLHIRTTVFEELINDLIMHAGDADTNACFAGAVLGAYLGYCALPSDWRAGLRYGDWLIGKAEALAVVLDLSDGVYDGKKDMDTYPDGGRGVLSPADVEKRFMELQAWMAENNRKYQDKRPQQVRESSLRDRLSRTFSRK